jgi:phenylacetate-CoA ligase
VSQGWAVALRELWYLPAVLLAPHRRRAAIERRALRGVRRMHRYARGRVPYYATDPAYDRTIDSLDDLRTLPVLDKDLVLSLGPERLHAARSGWYQHDRTSGTTGRVLHLRHDAGAYGYHGATVVRRFLSAGYRPWWTIAQLKPFARPHRWFQRFGLFPRTVVNAGQPESAVKDDVLRLRPRLLMGYPVMLRALLRNLTDAELAALRRRLRLVFTDSELVTEEARAVLAERFGVPVCDEYSAYEVLTVASHCRYGSMHVDEDRVVLELLDDAGSPVADGQEGAVVVTHYRERAMPLLRYRLGDRAIGLPPGCRCGSRFRRMVLTRGRSEDYIQLPDGRRVYVGTFIAVGLKVDGIAEFTVRQDADAAITLHLAPDTRGGYTFEQAADNIRAMLRVHLGADIDLAIVPLDAVPITPGGKAKLIESHYRVSAGE